MKNFIFLALSATLLCGQSFGMNFFGFNSMVQPTVVQQGFTGQGAFPVFQPQVVQQQVSYPVMPSLLVPSFPAPQVSVSSIASQPLPQLEIFPQNQNVTHRGAKRNRFTKKEDEKLRSLAQQNGKLNWCEIAAQMHGRSARQCHERYKNYISSAVVNGPWTPEEDNLLTAKYAEMGPKWSQMRSFFPRRSRVNIKNRYTTLLNRAARCQQLQNQNPVPAPVQQAQPLALPNAVPSSPVQNDVGTNADDLNTFNIDWLLDQPFGDVFGSVGMEPFDVEYTFGNDFELPPSDETNMGEYSTTFGDQPILF